MKKFVAKFMLGGLLVPVFFLLCYSISVFLIPKPWPGYFLRLYFDIMTFQFYLWPTSIWLMITNFYNLTMADIEVIIASIIANALLYSLVGIVVWFIKEKFRRLDADSAA